MNSPSVEGVKHTKKEAPENKKNEATPSSHGNK